MELLPYFQSKDASLNLLQTNWRSILNALLGKPQLASNVLQNVSLAVGSNDISHKLGRKLQGWKIVRQRSSASIYDNQDNNQMPQLTLLLISDAIVSIDLEVF